MNYLQAIGEFVLTDPNMKVKPRGKIYSINEGYTNNWDPAIREYVVSKKEVSHAQQRKDDEMIFRFNYRETNLMDLATSVPWLLMCTGLSNTEEYFCTPPRKMLLKEK